MGVLFLFLNHQYRERGPVHYAFLFSGCLMFLLLLGSFSFRIRSFEISSGNLVIYIGWSHKVYSLSGLQDVHVEEKPFAGARKEMGVGGVWSVSGRFNNPRFGRFYSYASDMSRGVLLSWADKKVLVTPSDAEAFMQSARSAH
jgi:hypothetical protein